MITWKFEQSGIFFKSSPENLDRDILKMAHANSLPADTKIIILDGNTNNTIPADASSSDGDTSTIPQSTVSVGVKKTKTPKHKTDELPTVSSDLDNATAESDDVASPGDDSNSVWSGDWFDGQRV